MPIPDAVLPTEPETEAEAAPSIDEIYAACNDSLACGIRCPKATHNVEDCSACGNEDCVIAFARLNKIWEKVDKAQNKKRSFADLARR